MPVHIRPERDAMTTTTDPPAATDPPPFARLVRELDDLDDEADTVDPARPAYTATDGRVTVTLDMVADPPRAYLEGFDTDGEPRWKITFTAMVPDATQLVTLYAAVNDDPAEALHAAAAALGVAPPDPATHTVAGGS